jgi:hypothetical protein
MRKARGAWLIQHMLEHVSVVVSDLRLENGMSWTMERAVGPSGDLHGNRSHRRL